MKLLLSFICTLCFLSIQAQDIAQVDKSVEYKHSSLFESEFVSTNDQEYDVFNDFTIVIYYDDKSFKKTLKRKKDIMFPKEKKRKKDKK